MNQYKFIKLKEEIIIEYILDIDLKGFLFKYKGVKDIMNYIFELRDIKCIRKF